MSWDPYESNHEYTNNSYYDELYGRDAMDYGRSLNSHEDSSSSSSSSSSSYSYTLSDDGHRPSSSSNHSFYKEDDDYCRRSYGRNGGSNYRENDSNIVGQIFILLLIFMVFIIFLSLFCS